MSKKNQETSTVALAEPRPAAAYLLGGHSRMVKGWLDARTHWSRDYLGLQPELVCNLNLLDAAVLDLMNEIEAVVQDDLRATIRAIKDCVVDDFDYTGGVQKWNVLCSEADRAFPHSHRFFGWYELGCVVGRYRQTVINLEEEEQLPDFRFLQDKAQEQLEESGQKISILQALVDLGMTFAERPVYALHKALGTEYFFDFEEGNGMAAGMLLSKLHYLIYGQVSKLTRIEESITENPIWDAENGVLFWRRKAIRKYEDHPALNHKIILGAFQLAGWPPRIDDPFLQMPHPPRTSLGKIIYEINTSLPKGTIRFGGDGTGKGIRWWAAK